MPATLYIHPIRNELVKLLGPDTWFELTSYASTRVHADVQASSWLYPPESAKIAFDFIKSRFDVMEPKGIQRLWFTLDKEHEYSLWSLLDVSEENWDQIARGTDLKSKTSRLVILQDYEKNGNEIAVIFYQENWYGGKKTYYIVL